MSLREIIIHDIILPIIIVVVLSAIMIFTIIMCKNPVEVPYIVIYYSILMGITISVYFITKK